MGKVDTSKQKEDFELPYKSFHELESKDTNPIVIQLQQIEKYLQEYRQFLIETRIQEFVNLQVALNLDSFKEVIHKFFVQKNKE